MPNSIYNRYRVEILKNPDNNVPSSSHSERGGRGGHRGGRGGHGGGGHRHDEPSYGCVKLSDPRSKNQTAKWYICVDQNEAFQVKIIANDMKDENTYGAVLFLDGQKIHGKKTFRRVTSFPGYKKGAGIYSEFLFDVPGFGGDERPNLNRHIEQQQMNRPAAHNLTENEKQLDVKHQGKTGTIIVEFYKTEEFTRRQSFPNRAHTKNYTEQPLASDTMKKNFSDSLCIKKGKDFTIGPRGPPGGRHDPSPNEPTNSYFRGDSSSHHYGGSADQSQQQSQYGNGFNNNRKRDQKFQDKRNSSYQTFSNQHGQAINFNDRYEAGNSTGGGGRGGGRYHHNNSSHGNGSQGNPRTQGHHPGWHQNNGGHSGGGNQAQNGRGDPGANAEMVVDYRVLYDEVIDCIEINYSNWAYLQCNKLVDVREYQHLKLTPQSLMGSSDFVTKVLWTVIKYNQRLHHSKCDDEFFKATGHKISDFFEFKAGDLIIFLKKRSNMFNVDEGGYATPIEFDERKEFNINQQLQRRVAQQNQSNQNNHSTASNASNHNTPATTQKPNVTAAPIEVISLD